MFAVVAFFTYLSVATSQQPSEFSKLGEVYSRVEISRRQLSDNGPLDGWKYVGCFTDVTVPRTLLATSFVSDFMTPSNCTLFCQGGAFNSTGLYNFAGVEYRKECYCDYNIQGIATQVPESECNLPCIGDNNYTCGGGNRISIYQDEGHGGVVPTNKEQVKTWTFDGCYQDLINGSTRILGGPYIGQEGVTIEQCLSLCEMEGLTKAGLEYGRECWCGNSFLVKNVTTVPVSHCSMACKDDCTELCGAGALMSVYTNSPVLNG